MWDVARYGYPMDYAWWYLVLASLVLHTWCFFRLTRPDRLPRLRLVAGNLLIALCLLQGVGLLAETYYRFFDMETDSYGVSLSSTRWTAMHVQLNELGHRDLPHTKEKPAGVVRVAFVGDSFTFGWGVDRPEDRFTDRIRARFRERAGGAVEVFNAAENGWETGDQMKEVQRLIDDYAVDEIVLCYCLNDIHDVLPPDLGFRSLYPKDGHLLNTDGSYLLNHLYHRWVAHQSWEVTSYFDRLATGYDDAASWGLQQSRLDWIANRCAEAGVTLRVAILPFVGTKETARAREKVASHFEAAGEEVIDLGPAIAGHDASDLVINRYDHHPSVLAHRIYADAIWEAFYGEGGGRASD